MNIFWLIRINETVANILLSHAHDLFPQTLILLVNHQFDKVVFAEILPSHCIILSASPPAKARQPSSVFDAVHLNFGRFKWLIFVNKRTLSGCQITAVTSMHRIISRRKCVFGTFFKNKKLNGSFSFCLSPHNCIHHVNTSAGKFNK